MNVQNNLCSALSPGVLTYWLDLLDGPGTCAVVCHVSNPVSDLVSTCSWLNGPDMSCFLTLPGTANGTCHCHQPGPSQMLQDYILVRLVTALPVLWRPQLLAYLSFGPVLLLLLPTRLCLVECIIWIIFNRICFVFWNNLQIDTPQALKAELIDVNVYYFSCQRFWKPQM